MSAATLEGTTVTFFHMGIAAELSFFEGVSRRWVGRGRNAHVVRARPTRVFVGESDESVFDNVALRLSRPTKLWGEFVTAGLEAADVDIEGVATRFSQRAGCSCPCSPGFFLVRSGKRLVLTGSGLHLFSEVSDTEPRFDVWVEIGDRVTVPDELALARAEQVAADPTL